MQIFNSLHDRAFRIHHNSAALKARADGKPFWDDYDSESEESDDDQVPEAPIADGLVLICFVDVGPGATRGRLFEKREKRKKKRRKRMLCRC